MLKIAILGSGGLLGHDLVRVGQSEFNILPYHRDIDITSLDLVSKKLMSDCPDVVINTAGLSNVDECEKNPEAAFHLNQQGPKNLAEVCSNLKIPIIHISTDYVFPGDVTHIYSETDIPNPVNVYGQSKWAGEKDVALYAQHYILRVSSLFGWKRDNHATKVLSAIKENKTISIATDMVCSPTYTGNLAQMIFNLIKSRPPYGIWHAVASGWCSRYEFAMALGKSSSNLSPISIGAIGLPAPRPLCLRLSSSKWARFMRKPLSWADMIPLFLNDQQRGKYF